MVSTKKMVNPLDLLFLGQSTPTQSLRQQPSGREARSVTSVFSASAPVFGWKAEVKGEGFRAYLPVMRLSTRVVGMQKIPTSRSLTARLRMNMLVTVRMCRFLSTVKQTRVLPTMQRRKMRA